MGAVHVRCRRRERRQCSASGVPHYLAELHSEPWHLNIVACDSCAINVNAASGTDPRIAQSVLRLAQAFGGPAHWVQKGQRNVQLEVRTATATAGRLRYSLSIAAYCGALGLGRDCTYVGQCLTAVSGRSSLCILLTTCPRCCQHVVAGRRLAEQLCPTPPLFWVL